MLKRKERKGRGSRVLETEAGARANFLYRPFVLARAPRPQRRALPASKLRIRLRAAASCSAAPPARPPARLLPHVARQAPPSKPHPRDAPRRCPVQPPEDYCGNHPPRALRLQEQSSIARSLRRRRCRRRLARAPRFARVLLHLHLCPATTGPTLGPGPAPLRPPPPWRTQSRCVTHAAPCPVRRSRSPWRGRAAVSDGEMTRRCACARRQAPEAGGRVKRAQPSATRRSAPRDASESWSESWSESESESESGSGSRPRARGRGVAHCTCLRLGLGLGLGLAAHAHLLLLLPWPMRPLAPATARGWRVPSLHAGARARVRARVRAGAHPALPYPASCFCLAPTPTPKPRRTGLPLPLPVALPLPLFLSSLLVRASCIPPTRPPSPVQLYPPVSLTRPASPVLLDPASIPASRREAL